MVNYNIALRFLGFLGTYIALQFFGGNFGQLALYPVTLLVTFMHELGHALMALLTGGRVVSIHIDTNGAGFTQTIGGWKPAILMGGYVGSALLGNALFYVGVKAERHAPLVINALALAMLFTSVIWFNSMITTILLIMFAAGLTYIATRTSLSDETLMFLGLASILYIIQDFKVGPRSDLEAMAGTLWLPMQVWMVIWLCIVVFLAVWNIRVIFNR
jgi:Peptidase M50B-like